MYVDDLNKSMPDLIVRILRMNVKHGNNALLVGNDIWKDSFER